MHEAARRRQFVAEKRRDGSRPQTFRDNSYTRGRTIPGRAVQASENHYRELRGEHPAWKGGRWYPPDHLEDSGGMEVEADDGFLG